MLAVCSFFACVALVFRATVVQAALNTTSISSAGCVDAADFNTCISQADSNALTCENAANGDKLTLYGCGIAFYEQEINCYLASCWNKVRNASKRCWLLPTLKSPRCIRANIKRLPSNSNRYLLRMWTYRFFHPLAIPPADAHAISDCCSNPNPSSSKTGLLYVTLAPWAVQMPLFVLAARLVAPCPGMFTILILSE
jgi:hypothetical protein